MIRYLTERLAVMITPKWVNTKTQPIAIRDVLLYLIEALKVEKSNGEIIEGLKTAGSEWLEDTDPDDDATFVVIQVK